MQETLETARLRRMGVAKRGPRPRGKPAGEIPFSRRSKHGQRVGKDESESGHGIRVGRDRRRTDGRRRGHALTPKWDLAASLIRCGVQRGCHTTLTAARATPG